jgi:peptidoglycan/LPS O-acetylase OafA/YrhL
MKSAVAIQPDEHLPAEQPPVRKPLGYMVQLDGLRALAIGSVMLFHYTAGDAQNASGTRRALDEGWTIFAGMGVTLFFVLSGFLITGILLKCREEALSARSSVGWSLRQFYIRRFLRIFPAFYLVILIAFVFAQQNRASLGWHAAYLSNVYFARQGAMLGPLAPFWSLAVEEQFYLVWPLVVLLTPPRRLRLTIVCIIIGSVLYRLIAVICGLNEIAVAALPMGCLDALGIGALLAVAGPGSATLEKLGLRLGSILWLMLVAAHLFVPMPRIELVYSRTVVALFSLGLVAGAARGFGGPFGWLLQARPIVYLGTISYGLYLYHNLTPRLLSRFLPSLGLAEHGPGHIVLLIASTVLIATVSWFFYEYPMNSLKRFFPYRSILAPLAGGDRVPGRDRRLF